MLVTLVTNGREFPGSRAFCRELVKRCAGITTIVQNVNERQTNVILGEREQVLYGPGFILDQLCGLSFRISSQSFYQVNAVQPDYAGARPGLFAPARLCRSHGAAGRHVPSYGSHRDGCGSISEIRNEDFHPRDRQPEGHGTG